MVNVHSLTPNHNAGDEQRRIHAATRCDMNVLHVVRSCTCVSFALTGKILPVSVLPDVSFAAHCAPCRAAEIADGAKMENVSKRTKSCEKRP